MHLSKVNEALDHRITGGSEYGWSCYGPNARFLDYQTAHAHASVVFDSLTQVVYSAEVNDNLDKYRPYRWVNPSSKQAMLDEATNRGINPNEAWDNVEWYDLETNEDWLEKARAIMRGESFDERIEVPLNLEDDLMLKLALEAHKRDITLNKMVEIVLQEAIDRHKETI